MTVHVVEASASFTAYAFYFQLDCSYADDIAFRFEGVWAHGDFCQINASTGGVVMLGRSDATLNRGGVRIGTAEIYSIVETFTEISDSIAAGQFVLVNSFYLDNVCMVYSIAGFILSYSAQFGSYNVLFNQYD
ncbi:unnamed protein product [Angiostrongylus costaricensis]|uniref:TAXi_C domain-containing protein n=1 Tax=Angiostrongylus costaricensis TaxID=334426 RepID=A0A0R3PZK1_ANGCS|nr:unnamed protein product [Angiostrongylus costaricensis]